MELDSRFDVSAKGLPPEISNEELVSGWGAVGGCRGIRTVESAAGAWLEHIDLYRKY